MKKTGFIVFLVAVIVNLAAGAIYGLKRPMESDAKLFLQIARSVADGDGYKLREGFWPDEPTMSRSPGWPLVTAGALRLKQGAWSTGIEDDSVMRSCCLLLNALNALLVYLLAFRVCSGRPALVASALYIFYPTAIYHAVTGDSEILFITFCLCGLLLSLRKGWWLVAGGVVFGAASLVRPNLVLLPMAVIIVGIANGAWKRKHAAGSRERGESGRDAERVEQEAGRSRRMLIYFAAIALFAVPSTIWSMRNYSVCGKFPVLSTLRGQTFYGGNNELVASLGRNWGYWVFPDSIPGEKSMLELSKTMSELEVDQYYMDRGKSYVAGNLHKMPMLWIGKLVRAYVPIPWRLSPGLAVVNIYRLSLYCVVLLGAFRCWKLLPVTYRQLAASFLLVNIITVLVFWGCARFAFAIEPVFLPFAAMALKRKVDPA